MIVTLQEITDRVGTGWREIEGEMRRLLQHRQQQGDLLTILIPEAKMINDHVPYTRSLAALADNVYVVDPQGVRMKCIKSRNSEELTR